MTDAIHHDNFLAPALAAWQESESRYRVLFENNPIALWVYDLKTLRFLDVNPAALKQYGFTREEFLNMTLLDIRPPEEIPKALDSLRNRDLTNREPRQFIHRKKDGTLLDVEIVSHDIFYANRPARLAVAFDVTERKRLIEQLQRKDMRLRVALDASGMRVWTLDLATQLIEQSDLPRGVHVNQPRCLNDYLVYVHPEDRSLLVDAIQRTSEQRQPVHLDFRVKSQKLERWFWRSVYLDILFDTNGAPSKLTGVTYDITDRKRIEEELTQITAELKQRLDERQDLLRRIVTVHEDERRRLARELHDEVGQLVAAFKLELKPLMLEEASNPRLQKLKQMADWMGERLHAMALQLLPTGLDDLGLLPVLRQYIDDWEARTGISVDCQCVGVDYSQRMPMELEITIYRIVQEALTNILKHAQAANVSVILEARKPDGLRLIVEDDGIGFDLQTRQASSQLGLRSMRERAELVGGCIEIETAPGRGTTLFITLPLIPAQAQEQGLVHHV